MKQLILLVFFLPTLLSAQNNSELNEFEQNCESARKKYLEQNQDVKNAGLDPMWHYNYYGKKEGRKWPECDEIINGLPKQTGNVEPKSIVIGNQIWTTENLNVSNFRNGDLIPEARTAEEWERAGENKLPVWCYYNNDSLNGEKYGKLYNWYAVNDPRGLAPVGWRIPSDADWILLSDNLGGTDNAGEKMKSNIEWYNNINGSNVSGFSGFPSGYRYYRGIFSDKDQWGCWWTSTESFTDYAWFRSIYYFDSSLYRDYYKEKGNGLSVRCIKEVNNTIEDYNDEDIVPNDISILEKNNNISPANLKSVVIGTQTWTTENLNVSSFRNGDPIPEARTVEELLNYSESHQPAWCYYNFDLENGIIYGKLYNSFAINDVRDICPIGWHLPTFKEWEALDEYLGGGFESEIKLKSSNNWESYEVGGLAIRCANCENWNEEYRSKVPCHICKDTRYNGKTTPIINVSGNGTNSSGFSALPGGSCYRTEFEGMKKEGMWFGNDDYGSLLKYYKLSNTNIFSDGYLVHSGEDKLWLSVRCVKD